MKKLGLLVLGLLFPGVGIAAAGDGVAHYVVKLTADFERQELRGDEVIAFEAAGDVAELEKQSGVRVKGAPLAGDGTQGLPESQTLRIHLEKPGNQVLHFEYTASAGRGLRWVGEKSGMFTAFYCDAWMICDNKPGQRATLRLEIVLPAGSALVAAGPGRAQKPFTDAEGVHFVFEQHEPVQTYLFSFGIAKLESAEDGIFRLYAKEGGHAVALHKTAEAYAFLRGKAGVDVIDGAYTQVFLPVVGEGFGQEAAGSALMSEKYLANLETKDDVQLMAHEMAHQWWGVSVGVRSWSDFWLNEGMAEFMSDAYLEAHQGKTAYGEQMAELRKRFVELKAEGKDRPLHWEAWANAREALGQIPYVKGALFLDRLRKQLGEEKFWRGIVLYTERNAGRLVDSGDFERAMEEGSGQDLKAVFQDGVYR